MGLFQFLSADEGVVHQYFGPLLDTVFWRGIAFENIVGNKTIQLLFRAIYTQVFDSHSVIGCVFLESYKGTTPSAVFFLQGWRKMDFNLDAYLVPAVPLYG